MRYCPHCGGTLANDITERQQKTLDAIRAVTFRLGGSKPGTLAVAMEIGYSIRWAYQFLRDLEELGYVHRPDGLRSGWAIVKQEPRTHAHRVIVPAAAAA